VANPPGLDVFEGRDGHLRLITYVCGGGDPRVGELAEERVRELEAPSMIAWLAGEGRAATGVEHAASEVELLAPIPEPPAYRDFMTYEGHGLRALRNIARPDFELPAYWYEVPGFYFGDTGTFRGPGQSVRRPKDCEWLDFELELAAVIGADQQLAGFTILNDWSARDVQSRESALGGLGIKAKDFATSLGPWIVTPDELPYEDGRLSLRGRVEVNGEVLTEVSTEGQYFGFDRMLAHAAQDSHLRPGDVLASGTLDHGCIAEMGPPAEQRWLQPGDRVSLIVEGLGELQNTIE
jgi:fumarylacetoacetate (FAA) hydrolase